MYEAYWGLQERPFEQLAEARFYYPSDAHQGALLKLRYAIEHRRAAALLTGPSGSGKTQILHKLTDLLPAAYQPLVHVVFPQMPADQLLAYLADELDSTHHDLNENSSLQWQLRRIQQSLLARWRQQRHTVIVLDEAHVLRCADSWETVRLLLNLQHQNQMLLTMILVGQSPILAALRDFPELEERLEMKCTLTRFTATESSAYLEHRLRVAGASRSIFTPPALDALHDLCDGIPRKLNRLADLALVVGYAEESPQIDEAQVQAVAADMLMPASD
ncbi:MAG: ExeA family protein [Planctomycetota bacterium]